jgi:hypothetical protein
MSELNLLPCPFCGSPAFMWKTINGYKVSCENDKGCVTMPPRFDISFTSPEEAEKHWNRRTDYNLALNDATEKMHYCPVKVIDCYDSNGQKSQRVVVFINDVIAAIEGLRRTK